MTATLAAPVFEPVTRLAVVANRLDGRRGCSIGWIVLLSPTGHYTVTISDN